MKKLLILLICLISFISYSQDRIELNYNTINRLDTISGNLEKVHVSTYIIIKDNDLSINFDNNLSTYSIYSESFESFVNEEGDEYVTYIGIDNKTRKLYRFVNIRNDFILFENQYIFRFYNE